MDDVTEKTPFEIIVELLTGYGVQYIVIGGQAETLYGSARVSFDTDLCYRRTQDNLRRLAGALKDLKPRLRGAPADLPFRLDAESLALGCNFTFVTEAGDLDLPGHLEPLGGYEELVETAETIRIGDLDVPVISLDDLIRIKEHIQRPKDRESLMHLKAIKNLSKRRRDRD